MSQQFSYAQLKAALFARERGRVHAVVDARAVPGLPALLQESDTGGWDCLERGALSADAMRQAAYIVELKPAAPFTDWLLAEATVNFPGWGLAMPSQQPLLAMREHCRGLDDVVMPDGQRRPWRWYDPELLVALLPSFSAQQHDELFAAGQQIVLPTARAWTWFGLEQGVLASTERALMRESR